MQLSHLYVIATMAFAAMALPVSQPKSLAQVKDTFEAATAVPRDLICSTFNICDVGNGNGGGNRAGNGNGDGNRAGNGNGNGSGNHDGNGNGSGNGSGNNIHFGNGCTGDVHQNGFINFAPCVAVLSATGGTQEMWVVTPEEAARMAEEAERL